MGPRRRPQTVVLMQGLGCFTRKDLDHGGDRDLECRPEHTLDEVQKPLVRHDFVEATCPAQQVERTFGAIPAVFVLAEAALRFDFSHGFRCRGELPGHEVAQGGLLPEFCRAADVSDLGRLLLPSGGSVLLDRGAVLGREP